MLFISFFKARVWVDSTMEKPMSLKGKLNFIFIAFNNA